MSTKKFKATLSPAEFDALESDEVKGFYSKVGDNYIAGLEGAETEEQITALRNAKNHEKTEADKLKKQLDSIQKMLGDAKPEDIQKIIADARTAQEEALKTAGKWDEMKAQMRDEFVKKELDPARAEVEKYKAATEKYLIDSQWRKAVDELKPFEGAADALLPHVKPHVRLIEENGELKPRLFEGDVLQVNGKGEPMSFAEFADKNFRQSPVFGRFFQADDTAGSGSPAFSGGGNPGGGQSIIRTSQGAITGDLEGLASGAVKVIG